MSPAVSATARSRAAWSGSGAVVSVAVDEARRDAALEEDAGSSVVQPARPSAAAPDAAIAERRVAFTPATLSPGPAPDPGRYRG